MKTNLAVGGAGRFFIHGLALHQRSCAISSIRSLSFTASFDSHFTSSASLNWTKTPSPRTATPGTHLERLRDSGALLSGGSESSSDMSPADSIRVNPIKARTSVNRSTRTIRAICFGKELGTVVEIDVVNLSVNTGPFAPLRRFHSGRLMSVGTSIASCGSAVRSRSMPAHIWSSL